MSKVLNVEQYLKQHPNWEFELKELRNLFLSFEIEEGIKWGAPVYMIDGKNLFGLGAFKNHYAIWFFQGGLLKRNTALLVNTQEGKTQAMRQIKFEETSNLDLKEISKYIEETISLHRQGKKITTPAKKEIVLSEYLLAIFKENQVFEKAFQSLSPGKQREYSDYITQAKREETRNSRLEKITPMILAGKGLNDKYKNY